MEVVLIKYRQRYEDFEEIVGIALNMEVAKRYIEYLKEIYPHAYDYDSERFYFEEHKVIEE